MNKTSTHETPETTGTSNGVTLRPDMGPAISDTRISIYTIMDYLHDDWPPKLIRDWLGLTQAQIDAALAYICAHREQLETDYQRLEKEQERDRQYWEERNRNLPKPKPVLDSPEKAALWAKLEAWKKQFQGD
jgi:uncharacterized protein (DUF433 family)